MSGFRSDLGQLGKHAGEFDDLAGQAQQIADTLRRAVESAGDCWGGDEIGASFAQAHCGRAEQALSDLGEMSSRLRGMGSKFAAAAATTQQVDADNAEELGRIAGRG
ncbi:hypothetical protein LZ318_37420 [Saccharopolyspora indica]|uniref:WXG100 family type VII secretion target n=1 Tax=Saccharopolyspora indica TaxID=1229659 RepID=UPI0022EAC594|nr:hypothetical protein [Saccharopolyspora indica]MDA3647841.1 hypothetical protein [Saccharopolyspora indica]